MTGSDLLPSSSRPVHAVRMAILATVQPCPYRSAIPTRAEAARLLILRGIEADKAAGGGAKPATEAPARKR